MSCNKRSIRVLITCLNDISTDMIELPYRAFGLVREGINEDVLDD
jgi:hypothetical protein